MPDPILITGVGKRLGLALAKHLLQRDIPVIGTYRRHYDSIDELAGMGAELHPCDFNDAEQLDALIARLCANHNSLRGIVHNASDWLPDKSDMPPALVMERMMHIHAKVPYQLNFALRHLLEQSRQTHADIIHISDFVAQTGSKKHMAYAASKAALENLTLSFASLLAPKVKVNAIAPALMLFNEHDDEAYRKKALGKALLQREGGEAEFIRAVDYLLGSEYITGRVLSLDGGRHLKRS